MAIRTVDPATGRALASYDVLSEEALQDRLERSTRAFRDWRESDPADRSDVLRAIAARLREHRDRYADLMTAEMGKPLAQAKSEVEKCAWVADYYADHGEDQLEPDIVRTDASRSYVLPQPLGPVLGIMPWNFPFWQVLRYACPALMAGNAILLKHAENTTGCGLEIETLMTDAGLPDDLFQTLVVEVERIAGIIASEHVAAVTLTGSTRAGAAVAAEAGRHIKKTVLELGGNDAYVVLEDADLDAAADACVTSRMINSGQSCIAAKRLIVVEAVKEAFTERVLERMAAQVMGEPTDPTTTFGPLAREDLRDGLHAQVEASVAGGAKLLLGGTIPDRDGWFYPATVLVDPAPGTPAWREELFGPVAVVTGAADEDDALRIAADSEYGLGAAVFTEDLERGERIADSMEAGSCFVNGFVKSDPRLPFGGIKRSGYGRELSALGIREFVNMKTVWIA